MSEMTHEWAVEQAKQLRTQGKTYPEIEEHFKRIGYVSPKTKKPVGHLAIRHMVTASDKKEKQEFKEEEKSMKLIAPHFRDTVRKICEIPGIDEETFMGLLKALMVQQEQKNKLRA